MRTVINSPVRAELTPASMIPLTLGRTTLQGLEYWLGGYLSRRAWCLLGFPVFIGRAPSLLRGNMSSLHKKYTRVIEVVNCYDNWFMSPLGESGTGSGSRGQGISQEGTIR